MDDPVVLSSIDDMTLANAARVAFDRVRVSISDETAARIAAGRARFEEFMRAESVREGGKVTPLTKAEDAAILTKHAHAVIYKEP